MNVTMQHDCKKCLNYKTIQYKEGAKPIESCGKEDKMTFNQYEDYFIDMTGKCPYYKEKAEDWTNE